MSPFYGDRRIRRLADADDFDCEVSPLPAEPTAALPGTAEKERIMTERAARRQSCFHPADMLLTEATARALGLSCYRTANGEDIWFRPSLGDT